LIDNINKISKEYNMKINTKKTKIMCISRQWNRKVRISIDGQQVEQVDQFKYIGSAVSADRYRGNEIRRRIAQSKQTFMNKKKLFTGTLSMEFKRE